MTDSIASANSRYSLSILWLRYRVPVAGAGVSQIGGLGPRKSRLPVLQGAFKRLQRLYSRAEPPCR